MKRNNFPSKRINVLIAMMALWAAVIGVRLYFLHVVHSADYRQRALRQQQRTIEVSPRRGVIYDRNGNELAISIKVDSVFAVPDEIENVDFTAKSLSSLIGVSKKDLVDKLDSQRSFVWIKRKVNAAAAAAIRRARLPGIYFQKEDMRYYPKRELASHVLGYVDIDEKGLGGLEYRYNDSIRGDAGRLLFIRDARGRSFNRIDQPVSPGANLITTIDQNIQYMAEREIAATAEQTRARGVSIIVMDPRTREILAMGNYPTFNLNEYAKYSPQAWINRAVSHTYEPGSTFKIVTAASAFEEGLADPAELIYCENGVINVFGRLIHDHKRFGLLTVKQIMQESSDVGAIKLALRMGYDRFADHIALFGFGKTTNVDLPGEEHGRTKSPRWTKSSIGSVAMGQEISVTPLQIVRMVSAVANGGTLYQPYVVKKVDDPQKGILSETAPRGERAISAETATKLQDMLESVVTDGTGKSGRLDGYTAAGKTGTAQKIDETGHYSATKYVASFVGFAPARNPLVSIIVMVDEPVGAHHGGDVAAPVFKRIAEQVLRYMSVPPDVPSYAPQYTIKGPKPERKPERGPRPATAGAAQLVSLNVSDGFGQQPRIPEFGDIAVPDFHGKSLRQVTEECLKAGLHLQSVGSGAAVEQAPPAGSSVRAGTRIEVRFSSRVER